MAVIDLLSTLSSLGGNLRDYRFNKNEPPLYPFERTAGDAWDWTRFDPAYFRRLEHRVADLLALGIEADIILFHSQQSSCSICRSKPSTRSRSSTRGA